MGWRFALSLLILFWSISFSFSLSPSLSFLPKIIIIRFCLMLACFVCEISLSPSLKSMFIDLYVLDVFGFLRTRPFSSSFFFSSFSSLSRVCVCVYLYFLIYLLPFTYKYRQSSCMYASGFLRRVGAGSFASTWAG